MKLGDVDFVRVTEDIVIANMCNQRDIYPRNGIPPIRYEALRVCLKKVANEAKKLKASVHMPRIGSDRAGGKWEIIEAIIQETLIDAGLRVFVYDLPPNDPRRSRSWRPVNRR